MTKKVSKLETSFCSLLIIVYTALSTMFDVGYLLNLSTD